MSKVSQLSADEFVPISNWGRDHWSMLAYFETVQVEFAGVEVKFDARMRQNRRHFRVMPKTRTGNMTFGVPMNREYGSRLNDGTFIPNHDDWNCVQDFANEGFLIEDAESIEPLVTLHLSEKGRQACNDLREHKMSGGSFGDFQYLVREETVS